MMTLRDTGFAAALAIGLLLGGCGGDIPEFSGIKNVPPVANAGSDQRITVGTTVTLDGSASGDHDGDPLTYTWTLATTPHGSTAKLSSATDKKPTFKADVAGSYVAQLVVNDTKVDSSPATVTITAVAASGPITTAGPSVSGTISSGTTLSVTIDEAGTGYYLVQPTAATTPTVQELMSGTPFSMKASVAATQPISGLSANTAYTIYFVAKDVAGNVQSVVQSVAVMTTCMAADAAVVGYLLGTAAPPAAIGSYAVQPFAKAAQAAIPDNTSVTSIPGSPITGTLTLSVPGIKQTVPDTWRNWSHQYTGPVFFPDATTITLTLPPGARAFYFYVEPDRNGPFDLTVTANSGSTCGPTSVSGSSSAAGFAFTAKDGASITSITISAPAESSGVALGEFAIGT